MRRSRRGRSWSASAPLRADLAGGTLDLWPLYLLHPGACTVNLALRLRARVEYRPGGDCWHLETTDREAVREVAPDAVASTAGKLPPGSPFALVLEVLAHLEPTPPGRLVTAVEGPPGGGLSGSSALLIACCGVLGRVAGQEPPRATLPALARDLEVKVLGVPTGEQDYYPAIYGGVQALEYGPGGTRRRPLEADVEGLEARLVLAYSGVAHASGETNWSLYRRRLEGDQVARRAFDAIADAGRRARDALRGPDWQELGRAMDADWKARQRMDPEVAPRSLRCLEEAGRRAGALAAKACGAAGGGCMLFLLPDAGPRADVEAAIRRAGGTLVDARVARSGLRVWSGAP